MLEAYDAGLYIIDTPRTDRCDPSSYQPALDAIVAAQKATAGSPCPSPRCPKTSARRGCRR